MTRLYMSFVICISLFCMESIAFIPGMRVAEVAVVMNMKKQIGRLLIATSLIQIPFGDVNPAFAALPQIDGVQVDTYSYPYIHTCMYSYILMLIHAYMQVQPDNIDRRRVMEEPVGAPEQTKATVVRLPSGVQYFDVKAGTGPAAEEGKTVQFQWVLRRSNGYFVDASSNYDNEPFIYKVGNTKKVIKGIDEAIRGMKVGGIRRMNIPPNVAFTEGVGDDKPGPMPQGFGPRRQILTRIDKEVWYYEIQLVKVRQ